MIESDDRVDARVVRATVDVDDESERENRPPGKPTGTTAATRGSAANGGGGARGEMTREASKPPKVVRASDEASDEDEGWAREARGEEETTTAATETLPTASVPASVRGRGVAFFDLDHTIIDVNSSWLWVKSEINSGRVGMSLIGTAVYWFSRYAFGYGDGAETAGKDAASLYKGESEQSFRERITNFFHMELAHRIRPGFKRVLDAHKANGERCVLCTSTWQHPAAVGAEIYGLETGELNVVSSIMGVDDEGRMDGTIRVVAYGDGKYETTKRWCDKNGVDLKDCYFYTDSMSDVKLLENVGYPVCVNPDSRLKKHAAERGWPTVDWGKSESILKKPRYSYGCLSCSA